MKKIKVQMVGSYYVCALEYRLPKYEYIVQNILSGLSPLTLCGPSDKKLIEEWELKIRDLNQWNEKASEVLYKKQTQNLFDLKKNFEKFLSRDQNEYCDNVVFSSLGKEVIYRNEADYLIVDHSAFIYGLIKLNNVLYTNCYPSTPFLEHIKSQSGAEIIFPVSKEDFNWRFYFDKYINTILNNYDNSKVILIKTPYSEFFSDKGSLYFSESNNKANANFIMELDEYFARKTGCLVIDTFEGKIPSEKRNMTWPFCAALEPFSDEITAKIVGATRDTSINKTYFSIDYNSPIANAIKSKIKTDKCAELINYAEQNRIVTWNKMLQSECGNSLKPFENLLKKDETLFDYIKSFLASGSDAESLKNNVNLKLVEDYTAVFNCSLNDILAVYKLYELWESKSDFKNIALNICNQTQNAAIKACDELTQSNIKFLKNYEYIDHDILDKIQITQKKYLHICHKGYLVIDPLSDAPFTLDYGIKKDDIDITSIIKNDCVCTIQFADALTFSYDYYVEKNRKGMGQIPTHLKFDTVEEFRDSILYENYKELLENERFVFDIGNSKFSYLKEYEPIVDISEMFDPEVVTVKITAGLGDQTGRYIFGKIIEKYSNRKIIYDDLEEIGFNGIEIYKIIKKDEVFLSKKLSPRLIKPGTFKNLCTKISNSAVYVYKNEQSYEHYGSGFSCFKANSLENFVNAKLPYSYYNATWVVTTFKRYFDFNFREYIEFPPFDNELNIKTSEKIISCDSIVMQVRRGDFVTLDRAADTLFYSVNVKKIMKLSQYKNKKFFIFSDDIPWCRQNKEQLGLDKVGDCEIVFVDWNKGEDAYRDVQLMALGKIMIGSISSFFNMAALYNENCEIFICSNAFVMDSYENFVKKNKYDIAAIETEDDNKSKGNLTKTTPQ